MSRLIDAALTTAGKALNPPTLYLIALCLSAFLLKAFYLSARLGHSVRTVCWPNKDHNDAKAINLGKIFLDYTAKNGLSGIIKTLDGQGILGVGPGHQCKNLKYCSYLNIATHPKIIQHASTALKKCGALVRWISRIRTQMSTLLKLEEHLSGLFATQMVSAVSPDAATTGVLPILASSYFDPKQPPPTALGRQNGSR